MSSLEHWIGNFARSGAVNLDNFRDLLKQYPGLPWLQLTQYGFSQGSTRVSLQTSFRHVRLDLENWSPTPVDLQVLQNFPDRWMGSELGKIFKLLFEDSPTALSVFWQTREQHGSWILRPGSDRQTVDVPLRKPDSLMVHISWKPSAVSAWRQLESRHGQLLSEYQRHTHFAGPPIFIQGRIYCSSLDIGLIQRAPHFITATLAEPGEDAFACAPPIIFNPYAVEFNGHNVYSAAGISEGLRGRSHVLRYRLLAHKSLEVVTYDCAEFNLSRLNLEHPELLVAYDMRCAPKSFHRIALKDSEHYLLPLRRVGSDWMVRYSIRPYRVSKLICIPADAAMGQGFLLPVKFGVCLSPLQLPQVPQGTLVLAACPDTVHCDESGFQLQLNDALKQWRDQLLQDVLTQAH